MNTTTQDIIYLMSLCEEDLFAYMFPNLCKMQEMAVSYLFHLFSNALEGSVCKVLWKGQVTKEPKLGKETCFQYS